MNAFAELEINLRRRGESDYTADFRFCRPNSAAYTRIGVNGMVSIHLDLIQLRALSLNLDSYGRTLTSFFFSDPQVKLVFLQARSVAETENVPMHVRLAVDTSAIELHAVYWELLQDPDSGAPLFTGENLLFSRYLSSPNMRPIRLRKKEDLSALVFVANPDNLADYKNLAPINVEREFHYAMEGLGEIRTQLYNAGAATLEGLLDTLSTQKPAILYLVCHGGMLRDEPYLLLENTNGRVKLTPGRELVNRLKELTDPPLLVVLASCESMGYDTAGDMRASLGPSLAEAGIPVIVAMQGNISMETVAEFMPIFFRELHKDGQVLRAMMIARGRIRKHHDFWMPVLFSRLISGSLVDEPEKPRRRLLNWRTAALTLALLLTLGSGLLELFRVKPMEGDVNVAIAAFTQVDESG
ncbi:MAG: CHAT domain-containing protein, partial [Anaerolineaceae bacterium]|nr:CHAT domain-containing protein [Anaerolineaceae bacterium]